jgi:hypothetical protein
MDAAAMLASERASWCCYWWVESNRGVVAGMDFYNGDDNGEFTSFCVGEGKNERDRVNRRAIVGTPSHCELKEGRHGKKAKV